MGTETYPKGGKTTHKSFGTEREAKFAPGKAAPEYQQVGSKDRYSGGSGGSGDYKVKAKSSKPFAKAGGPAQVSATYGRSLKQNGFGTKANVSLKAPMSDKPKEA